MKGFKFPRSYADLEAAPWCDGYMPPKGCVSEHGEHLSIFIKPDWLSEDLDGSPGGSSLKDALHELRHDFWQYMQPPQERQ